MSRILKTIKRLNDDIEKIRTGSITYDTIPLQFDKSKIENKFTKAPKEVKIITTYYAPPGLNRELYLLGDDEIIQISVAEYEQHRNSL